MNYRIEYMNNSSRSFQHDIGGLHGSRFRLKVINVLCYKFVTVAIDLSHSAAMLSLNSRLGEASRAKTKLFILMKTHTIDHFTVVSSVTWPWIVSETGVDLVLIETSLLFVCKSCCSYAN